MILTFRQLQTRPAHWLPPHADRPRSPFTAPYKDTLAVLDRELEHLGARDVFLQVETAGSNDVRLDGQLRANATVVHPGAILTIDTKRHGTLVYETDRFDRGWGYNAQPGWQVNLRAIALGLEALRKVDRYGIARRGEQYAGYRELGAGVPLGPVAMTFDEAAAFITEHAWPDECIDPQEAIDQLDLAYRAASKRLHPDAGGDPDLFRRLTEARDVIEAYS